MTEERTVSQRLPQSVVEEDQQLEVRMESTSKALAHLRWHWTLDEDNPRRVSFAQYGRDVARDARAIWQYARGYANILSHRELSVAEAIERANHSAEKQAVIEAVAEVNNITYITARQRRPELVREVKDAVDDELERRDDKGAPFPIQEREAYARQVAQRKKASRDAEERHRAEQHERHNAMFMDIDARLSKARREMKEALDAVQGVEFSDEEVELLERQNEAVQGVARLFGAALTGDSGTDWDAELAILEERRQYG